MAADTSQQNTPSKDDNMVDFSKVTTLCKRWMIDFHFVSMCRYFKEDQIEEFEKTVNNLDAILGSLSRIDPGICQKKSIAGFVTMVMHGKNLDLRYGDDEETPLLSAINVWKDLKETVADDSVFECIRNLLYIQSVAVCLEKDQFSVASTVLKWLQEECEIPKNLGTRLSSIIKKKDTYHAYFVSFSFPRLLEAVQNFLEAFLKLHPCDFLLKAATKVVKVCPAQLEEDSGTEESQIQSESTSDSTPVTPDDKKTPVKRPRKKLLSTENELPWKPESGKKAVVVLSRIENGDDGNHLQPESASPDRPAKRRVKRKWTELQDSKLIEGVSRYGEGKWSQILLSYNFPNRTSVMLKDRWRILKKYQA